MSFLLIDLTPSHWREWEGQEGREEKEKSWLQTKYSDYAET